MSSRRPGEDRVLTLPNVVTVVRLLCIPVFVVLLAQPHRAHWAAAAWLLAALGATDWVDGQLARRLHQVSTAGKVLDPLADRLLLGVGVIAIIAVGAIPLAVALVALAREVVVGVGFVVVAAVGGRRMDVALAGKAATFALMAAFPLFLLGHARISWHEGPETAAWVCVIPGLVFGWYSAIRYVPAARRALAERTRREVEADRA